MLRILESMSLGGSSSMGGSSSPIMGRAWDETPAFKRAFTHSDLRALCPSLTYAFRSSVDAAAGLTVNVTGPFAFSAAII